MQIIHISYNLLDTKNKLGIYHALVSSHLNYGISVWGDSKTSYIKKIETMYTKKRNKKHRQWKVKCTHRTNLQKTKNTKI